MQSIFMNKIRIQLLHFISRNVFVLRFCKIQWYIIQNNQCSLWSCVQLQVNQSCIVDELCVIVGVAVELHPTCLLLGLQEGHISNIKHKRSFRLLTFAARENIVLCWIKAVVSLQKCCVAQFNGGVHSKCVHHVYASLISLTY